MNEGCKIDKVYILTNSYDKTKIEKKLKRLTARSYTDPHTEFSVVEEVAFVDSFEDISMSDDSLELAFEIIGDSRINFKVVGEECFSINCVEGSVLDLIYCLVVYFGAECWADLDYFDAKSLFRNAHNSYHRSFPLEKVGDWEIIRNQVYDWVNSIIIENKGNGLLSDDEMKVLWFFRVTLDDNEWNLFLHDKPYWEAVPENIVNYAAINFDSCLNNGVSVSVWV